MAPRAPKSRGRGRGRGNTSGTDAQQTGQPAASQPPTFPADINIISPPSPPSPTAQSPSAQALPHQTAALESVPDSSPAVVDAPPTASAEQQAALEADNASLLAQLQSLQAVVADQSAEIAGLRAQLLAQSQSSAEAAVAAGVREAGLVRSCLESEELCHRLDELRVHQARAESVRAAAWADLKRRVNDVSRFAVEPKT